jgi:hypothetical protein
VLLVVIVRSLDIMERKMKHNKKSQKAKNPKTHKDRIKGGLADKKQPLGFNQKALKQGIKVEAEHTTDREIAMEIAMDHLSEDSKYYKRLSKMEKEAKREKTRSKKTC